MMQTVNAGLMKATVQDMQTYLQQLHQLLHMDTQTVQKTTSSDLSTCIQQLNEKLDTHQTMFSRISEQINQLSERVHQFEELRSVVMDTQSLCNSLVVQSQTVQLQPSLMNPVMDNTEQKSPPMKTVQEELQQFVWREIPIDSSLVSSSVGAVFSCDYMNLSLNSNLSVTKLGCDLIKKEVQEEEEEVQEEEEEVQEEQVQEVQEEEQEEEQEEVQEEEQQEVQEEEEEVQEEEQEEEKEEVQEQEQEEQEEVQEQEQEEQEEQEEVQEQEQEEKEEVQNAVVAPVVEVAPEKEEEEEEEGEEVEEITYNGETYYKDSEGFIYKPEDDTPIGYWKEKTKTIAFYRINK
jgi:DNA repair exonuclease SbcCD ATPase subunit